MSKRIYELARDLNMTSDDLVGLVKEVLPKKKKLDHLLVLDDNEIDSVMRRIAQNSDPGADTREVNSGVLRRRTKLRGDESDDAPAAAEPAAEERPAARRVRKVATPDAAPAEAPAAVVAEPTPVAPAAPAPVVEAPEVHVAPAAPAVPEPVIEAEPVSAFVAAAETEAASAEATPVPVEGVVRRRTRITTVVTREAPAEPAVEVEVVAEVSSVSETPDPDAPKRRRFATVVTRDVPAVPADDEPEAPSANDAPVGEQIRPVRSRFQTVHTTEVPAVAASDADLAAFARPAEPRLPSTGGARVVGMISPEALVAQDARGEFVPRRGIVVPGTERPGAAADDRRGAGAKPGRKGPAPASAGGKRVVQSRDLYDRSAGRGKGGAMGGRKGKKNQPTPAPRTLAAEHKRVVRMEEAITVGELAQQMSVKAGEVALKLMFELGMKGAMINTTVDFDTAQLLAELWGYKVEQVGFDINKYLPKLEENEEDYTLRPPVVTVMGHVDHGKTSLLDAIRSTRVASGEAGGITQHIGAYRVTTNAGDVCFLDTPGHEAFSALRARGAKATDIVVLVVAADDGVMPQTVEAINHAKDADVPIIVAVNKVDKPGANIERIKQALTEYQLVPEEWGGSTLYVETSAKTGQGIEELLETVALQAEVQELTANPKRQAEGLVIESKLDVGRGPVVTVLVQAGTLRQGEIVVVGQHYGRVRTMTDDRGQRVQDATPSTPVELTGLSGVPASGERFYVVNEEKDAKTIAEHVSKLNKQAELAQSVAFGGGLEGMSEFIRAGKLKELKVILKGDVQGSVEALAAALLKLTTGEVRLRIVHQAVGSVTENDINLAASGTASEDTGVVVIAFAVKVENRAQSLANELGVTILSHEIIYEIIDRVRGLMAGLLEPEYIEEALGTAEVRATFHISKINTTVAGCMVTSGVLERNAKVRVMRDGKKVHESSISSLRNVTQDVKQMRQGFECGVQIDRFNDVREGDILECYKLVQIAATL